MVKYFKMEQSYYFTGWKLVSSEIPLHLKKNYAIYKEINYNADVILGVIDAVGVFSNLTLKIPYINEEFLKVIKVPYKLVDDNIIISKVNYIDFMGQLYVDSIEKIYNERNYVVFNEVIGCVQPVVGFIKKDKDAISPSKTNFSDAGYDISIIKQHKVINSKTTLYDTGISLEIPEGYYVEIVPRSSIIKSGYILSNNIGIIDCGYKGNLYIALTKIADDAISIEYPFKCCQLITRKQVFSDFQEITDNSSESVRGAGGFGSTNT